MMLLPILIWLVWAMARGAVTGEYPYPILDADMLGYGQVAINCLFVLVGLLLSHLAVIGLDLTSSRATTPASPSMSTEMKTLSARVRWPPVCCASMDCERTRNSARARHIIDANGISRYLRGADAVLFPTEAMSRLQ